MIFDGSSGGGFGSFSIMAFMFGMRPAPRSTFLFVGAALLVTDNVTSACTYGTTN
jgi:hypothetical protein